MSTAISIFDQPVTGLPAHLAAFGSSLGTDLAVGGLGRNRLGLKGNRFRLIVNGQEEAVVESLSLEVVIVGASAGVGRIYFGEEAYDADVKSHPLCYSANGIEPGSDVVNPQAVKCNGCPKNEKGSKITAEGVKTKACSYFKRLAVVLLNDPEHRVFQLDGKALTIFGQGEPAQNKFTLSEYSAKFKTRGLDPAHFVTKLSFDTESSVPKLYFSPARMITEDEAVWVMDAVTSDDVKQVCTITAITDTSDADAENPGVPKMTGPNPNGTAAPAAPKAASPQPKAAPAPAPKAAPAPAPAAAAPKTTIVRKAVNPVQPAVKEIATGNSDLDAFLAQLEETQGEGAE
jgi:hypothetical protein